MYPATYIEPFGNFTISSVFCANDLVIMFEEMGQRSLRASGLLPAKAVKANDLTCGQNSTSKNLG